MDLEQSLKNVTVVGVSESAGKHVASLVTLEVAKLRTKYPDTLFKINLIDENEQEFDSIRRFIKAQMSVTAEKSIVHLRTLYDLREDLVENWEIIDEFVTNAMSVLRFDTDLEISKNASLIFSAIEQNSSFGKKIFNWINGMDPKLPIVNCAISDPLDKKNPVVLTITEGSDKGTNELLKELNERFSKKFI